MSVANIRGQRQDAGLNVGTVLVPAFKSLGNKRVAQIVNARMRMAASSTPTELSAQDLEGILQSTDACASPTIEDEERIADTGQGIAVTLSCITPQGMNGAWM